MIPYVCIASHPLCPYAQRCHLVLLSKGLSPGKHFDMKYVDLANISDWFRTVSPNGQMPAVMIDSEILFSTSAVCEYLDEVIPGRLFPERPPDRLRHRDFIVRAEPLLTTLKIIFTAKSNASLESAIDNLFDQLRDVEFYLPQSKRYFDDRSRLSMVDIAFAPFFSLAMFYPQLRERREWGEIPKLKTWGELLLTDRDVVASMCPRYAEEFAHFFDTVGSIFADLVDQPCLELRRNIQ